jgi:hypothetical protein
MQKSKILSNVFITFVMSIFIVFFNLNLMNIFKSNLSKENCFLMQQL